MTLSQDDLVSIIESVLFAIGRPVSTQELSKVFQIENISSSQINQALSQLKQKYDNATCGLELKEVAGAWQIRTKEDNKMYIQRIIKGRHFYISAPAMEVLSIIAYRQGCRKMEIDEVRGIDSGHLLKTLMEKNLIKFGLKSTLPGRPMTYKTTSLFLEVFGLKSLKELPSSEDISDLLPSDGVHEESPADFKQSINELKQSNNLIKQKELEKELNTVSEQIRSVEPNASKP